jgi:hypothetical protein
VSAPAFERPTPFRVYTAPSGEPTRAVIYAHGKGHKRPLRDVVDLRPAGLTGAQFRALVAAIEPAVQAALLELGE